MPDRTTRRGFLLTAAGASLTAAAGCRGGFPTIFGYNVGAAALYDKNVCTVYVPMCNNRAFQTTPYRGLEVDVTAAVVREIGAKTPFKVVSDPSRADTELLMNIADINKNLLNRTQQNTIREGEVVVALDVLWRDLRTGKVLSNTRPPVDPHALDPIPPFDPNVPVTPPVSVVPPDLPTRIVGTGRLLQELGETNASASKRAVDNLATQIVSLMEKPWSAR
jgi:hypothetical protein